MVHVGYSPDGQALASAGFDRTIRIWEAATGREIRALRGPEGAVFDVAYSPDGKALAPPAMADRTIRIWEAATGRETQGHPPGERRDL